MPNPIISFFTDIPQTPETSDAQQYQKLYDTLQAEKARARKTRNWKPVEQAQQELGESTLKMVNNTWRDPMKSPSFAEERDFYVKRGIRESDLAKKVSDYFKSFANSEGFERIKQNQLNWLIKRHPIRSKFPGIKSASQESINSLQKYLQEGLEYSNVYDVDTYAGVSYNNFYPGRFKIIGTVQDSHYGRPYDSQRDETTVHEMMHDANFHISGGQAEALQQNTEGFDYHDKRLTEKHPDLEALRYLLFTEGIYDSRSMENCTSEHIKKLREKYPRLRALSQMDDEKAAFMINTVADNGTSKRNPQLGVYAKNGGVLKGQNGVSRWYNDKIMSEERYKEAQRDAMRQVAVENALTRETGIAPNFGSGASCLYTVTDNFGNKYRVAGNQQFFANPEKYGWTVNGPIENVHVGDMIQEFRDDKPEHAVFVTDIKDGIPYISYSQGNANGMNKFLTEEQFKSQQKAANDFYTLMGKPIDTTVYDDYYHDYMNNKVPEMKKRDYKRNVPLYNMQGYETYRFIGTPEDNKKWSSEFENLPEFELIKAKPLQVSIKNPQQ